MKKSEKEFKEQRELREQQESMVLRRVLFWLCAAVLLEAYVLLTNRFYFHIRVGEMDMLETLHKALQASQFVFLGLFAVFAVWSHTARKRDPKRGSVRMVTGGMFAAAAVCSFLFLRGGESSVSVLQVAIPVLGVLVLIYYLYQKEFFAIATLSAMGILGLWLFRAGHLQYPTLVYGYLTAALVVIVACAIFFFSLSKKEGKLTWRGNPVALLSKDAHYPLVYATCAFAALLLLIPLAAGIAFAYYAIIALVIWVFVMAVYFTAKLM